jgi:16S rRNA (guanine(966)-N(2))-methyltransferase RsmD
LAPPAVKIGDCRAGVATFDPNCPASGRGGRVIYKKCVTRIVAGALGGRRLAVPTGRDTRPTSDRVREALFSTLESMVDLEGTRFADLYAGSGAVGLEALSRGAARVLLVESDPKAARVVRENVETLHARNVKISTDRVERLVKQPPDEPYDVIFADPPYALANEKIAELLAALGDGWLADEAVVVVERSSRSPQVEWVQPLTFASSRRYGETLLCYGRRS